MQEWEGQKEFGYKTQGILCSKQTSTDEISTAHMANNEEPELPKSTIKSHFMKTPFYMQGRYISIYS